ncbi:MAG TPA: DNA repair protein RecO [Alphaproteobacteria bacterium]
MEWRDEGLVLAVRRHGESAAIVSLLTRGRGRHAGLVRGGQSRTRRGLLQAGNLVVATWRARLAEHLGTLNLESKREFAAAVLDDPARLKALAAVTALLEQGLPEREPQPRLFAESLALVALLAGESTAAAAATGSVPPWAGAYVRWELALLGCLGFGLDLSACAATGARHGLRYVSPRSGRAVSAEAGAPYGERLLPLPEFLTETGGAPRAASEVAAGLRLTGHFLERHHFATGPGRLPAARARLVTALGG